MFDSGVRMPEFWSNERNCRELLASSIATRVIDVDQI
jgi:hypothetical protein